MNYSFFSYHRKASYGSVQENFLILILLTFSCLFFVFPGLICSTWSFGFVLGIIARFKKLHTFPNILITNRALADFFNAFINIPMYLL